MKVATWNVNSIRAREERLFGWLERHKPDVLCLQEIKVTDDGFPTERARAAGYHAAVSGQKTYNGVAILSRIEPSAVERGMRDDASDAHARLIDARVGGVRFICVYVPNGGEVGTEKFTYKLEWMKRFRSYLDRNCKPDEPLVVCGDINVAPEDIDVGRPDEWRDTVLCHEQARAALREIVAFGLVDAFRERCKDAGLYSWWDYRMLGFPKNNGLRIDHLFVTKPLVPRCRDVKIDRDERKGKQPSDHAPVFINLDDG
jgi:exodeoxyribonuclease-3